MKRLLRTLVASTFACLLLPLGAGQQATAADVTAAPTTAQADPIGMTSGFYTDPGSTPAAWAAANPGDGRAAAIRDNIAAHPTPGPTWTPETRPGSARPPWRSTSTAREPGRRTASR